MTRTTALVVGAHGVIGGNLIAHLESLGNWNVIGLSRRGGSDSGVVRHVALDLLEAAETARVLAEAPGISEVTHIFYAAYQDRPSWAELVAPNLAMLTNVVDVVERLAPSLEHISLMQGYKVYGAHLGPFSTPAREDDPPHMPPEFNVDQQKFLERRQPGSSWTWSALRPSVVAGVGLGNPMNLAMVIAVYASMSKALGIPLRFPGKTGAYTALIEMTDADLLAAATVWAATVPGSANQAYNITNGDVFRWSRMWPKIAAFFDLDVAPPLTMQLAEIMADKNDLWDDLVAAHGLQPTPYSAVSSWQFGDFVFGWDYDVIADTSKARRAGFHEYVETEEMFLRTFQSLRDRKLIP
jgi:nucleoside-diphosphate-sugar epimerase